MGALTCESSPPKHTPPETSSPTCDQKMASTWLPTSPSEETSPRKKLMTTWRNSTPKTLTILLSGFQITSRLALSRPPQRHLTCPSEISSLSTKTSKTPPTKKKRQK